MKTVLAMILLMTTAMSFAVEVDTKDCASLSDDSKVVSGQIVRDGTEVEGAIEN